MKRGVYMLLFAIAAIAASCSKNTNEVSYTPGISINFQNVGDSGITDVAKGVLEYNAKISVRSSGTAISYFEIYNADPRTGAKGSLIENTAQAFENGEAAFNKDYTITGLVENKCIKVVVTDTAGSVFEKNLVVRITPSVLFSSSLSIETVENYYGPYFATWLDGRVYMRRQEQYKAEIDFSLGDVILTDPAASVPALVSPAQRSTYGLITMTGLQEAKFEETTLTKAEFDNISRVDAASISGIADPQKDAVAIANGGIYVFKTAKGKKGLIHVSGLTKKSGTIEDTNGQWNADTEYHQAVVTVKTIAL